MKSDLTAPLNYALCKRANCDILFRDTVRRMK